MRLAAGRDQVGPRDETNTFFLLFFFFLPNWTDRYLFFLFLELCLCRWFTGRESFPMPFILPTTIQGRAIWLRTTHQKKKQKDPDEIVKPASTATFQNPHPALILLISGQGKIVLGFKKKSKYM